MKKFIAGFVIGIFLTLLMLFIWAGFSISHNFLRCVVVNPPIEEYLNHFGFAGNRGLPADSSKHYFFREGFGDVDEFWSFNLPPEQMESFVGEYATKRRMPKATGRFSSPITRPLSGSFEENYHEWWPNYWFSDLEELDEAYCSESVGRGDFVAYSKANGRVYLMNWSK